MNEKDQVQHSISASEKRRNQRLFHHSNTTPYALRQNDIVQLDEITNVKCGDGRILHIEIYRLNSKDLVFDEGDYTLLYLCNVFNRIDDNTVSVILLEQYLFSLLADSSSTVKICKKRMDRTGRHVLDLSELVIDTVEEVNERFLVEFILSNHA